MLLVIITVRRRRRFAFFLSLSFLPPLRRPHTYVRTYTSAVVASRRRFTSSSSCDVPSRRSPAAPRSVECSSERASNLYRRRVIRGESRRAVPASGAEKISTIESGPEWSRVRVLRGRMDGMDEMEWMNGTERPLRVGRRYARRTRCERHRRNLFVRSRRDEDGCVIFEPTRRRRR